MDFTDTFDALVADAQAHPISGWDFSYVRDRYVTDDLPWDFEDCIVPFVEKSSTMLDVDTGGGEFLLRLHNLAKHWPAQCHTIEAYAPNIAVAQDALSAIGATVRAYQPDLPLPFASADADAGFDLIINRHGVLVATEFARITRPGGRFVTQQVGADMNAALNHALGGPQGDYGGVTLNGAVRELTDAGYHIVDARESRPRIIFTDIGAIVWYLQSVPWQMPGFSVEAYTHRLRELDRAIRTTGSFQSEGHSIYIEATL